MRKTAAIIVTACALLWLAAIAGTVHWMATAAMDGGAADGGLPAGEAAEPDRPSDGEALRQTPDSRRLSPAQILTQHYGWFMGLSLTLGLLVYLPIAWLAWLVMRTAR